MFHDKNLLRIESSPYRADATDVSYLHAQISIAEEELRKLDVDLAILLARRSRVVGHIKRCRASVAPYSKLPTELIEKIIIFFVSLPCPLHSRYTGSDPRLPITQICSFWRKVAFEIPAIWNVHLEDNPREPTKKLISAWLQQCSSTQISLHARNHWSLPSSPHPGLVLEEVITTFAHRVKKLSFFPIVDTQFYSLRWDVLTSISLRCFPEKKLGPGDSPNMPNLREFRVSNLPRGTLLPSLPTIPWEQLTVLSLSGYLDISGVYDVLLRCSSSSLEQCHLDHIVSNTPNVLLVLDQPSLFLRLDLFSVPNISSLIISHPPDDPRLLKAFVTLMKSCRHTLRRFGLLPFGHVNSRAPMDTIMRAIPTVTHFITGQSIPLAMLTEIGAGELLPNLEDLGFDAGSDEMEEIMDRLILKQAYPNSCLRRVRIRSDNWWGLPRQIRDLLPQGMDVEVLENDPFDFESPRFGSIGWILGFREDW